MTNPPGAMPPLPERSPIVVDVARVLCRRHAESCGVDVDDLWKTYGDDFLSDADACAAPLIARVAELQAERDRMKSGLEWVRGHISRYDPPGLPNHVVQHIDAALTPTKD